MGIGDTFSIIFWQYSISILLSSDALVKSVNNSINLPKRVVCSLASKVDIATVLTH